MTIIIKTTTIRRICGIHGRSSKRSEDNSNHVKRLIDQLAEDNEGESLANYEPIDKLYVH